MPVQHWPTQSSVLWEQTNHVENRTGTLHMTQALADGFWGNHHSESFYLFMLHAADQILKQNHHPHEEMEKKEEKTH